MKTSSINGPILIYGAGSFGKCLFDFLTAKGLIVDAFLDQYARIDDTWHGVQILKPPDKSLLSRSAEVYTIIIAVHNRERMSCIPWIMTDLKGIGFKKFLTPMDIYNVFGNELEDRYWLTGSLIHEDCSHLIDAAKHVWADEKSKQVYSCIVDSRRSHDYELLPEPDYDDQYFPHEISFWHEPDCFVDCGAYDGDTLKLISEKGIEVNSVAAFEPDENNFRKLCHNVKNLRLNSYLSPCAVWSHTTQLRFKSGLGEGSSLSDGGTQFVQCVSIDEALLGAHPTHIKMDIEGAEYQALLGARETILRHRPNLAISLYHRPEHIWQIPLFLKNLTKKSGGGDLFLRLHAQNGFELILYGISRKS